jgi:Holliday junction resolvase RusA-like endonuclease
MIAFHIPGEPVAFARSGGKGAVRFTPKRQRDFMALIRLAAAQAMSGQEPFAAPVEMVVRAVYLIPKSWPKKKADTARWRTSKPDGDNLAKIISDAINTIVFADDSQVASLTVQKMYGPLAGVTVSVSTLEERGQ